MIYQGAEDRLNPLPPEDADESTLGGYPQVHGRAPAFEGCDGRPYTAAVEAEPDEADPGTWVGYLIFLRWADTGTAIMGHLETPDLLAGNSETEVRGRLEAMSLLQVKQILDDTIRSKAHDEEPSR